MDEPIADPNYLQFQALFELIEQLHAVYGKQIAEPTARVDKVEREGNRQAAPFCKKRKADQWEDAEAQVHKAVQGSLQVVGDETGWPVDGRGAGLHALIFGHDGWAVCNKFTSATHQQCFADLLRRCDSLVESGTGGALAFRRCAKDLLLHGVEYRNRFRQDEMTAHGMKVMAGRLTMQMRDLVRHSRTHAANERFARFLAKHLKNRFTFLCHTGADASNWRGEQSIRPAAVNPKVWGGSRTEVRALAQSQIMSVMQTCKPRLADSFDFVHRQLTAITTLALPQPSTAR